MLQSQILLMPDREVEYIALAEGAPLIVLEAGLGDSLATWRPIVFALAKLSGVFAYSRPGYGRSSGVATRRDVHTEASELDALLSAAGKSSPYLFVGHSLGGLIVQAYAAAFPKQVAGMVLVDVPHPDQLRRLQEDRSEQTAAFRNAASRLEGVSRLEFDALIEQDRMSIPGHPPYAGPVTLLAAMRPNEQKSAESIEQRRSFARSVAGFYPASDLRWVECGHYIHIEQPSAVVRAIADTLGPSNV